jgi:hypothetical protein
MARFQKPYTRWWLNLCSVGLVVCIHLYCCRGGATKRGP